MNNFILLFLTIAITSLTTTATNHFTCIDITVPVINQWSGNVEFRVSIKNLVSTFTDWRIELHFDQPVYRLEQWFGGIDDSFEIVHEKERVFIIKYKSGMAGGLALSSSSSYQSDIIASYNGYVEPKLQQAVLCGMTDAVYQARVQPIEALPAMFDSNAAIPKCIVSMRSSWGGTVQETINLPVTKDMKGWFVELKFDQPFTRIDQWTCKKVASDDTHLVCQNLSHNGRLTAGSSLSMKYQVSYKQQTPKLVGAWFNGYHCSSS